MVNQMTSQDHYTVSKGALVARINRRLRKAHQSLKKNRSMRWLSDFGDYYVKDVFRNMLIETHVDPLDLAKKLGVVYAGEVVESFE